MRLEHSFSVADAENTVWIFGAGASAGPPYLVPVQTAILQRLATMDRPGNKSTVELDALRQRVKAHCERVQPGVDWTSSTLCLEEIFSAYELTRSEPRSVAPTELQEAEQALRDLKEALAIATMVYGRGDARKWRPFDRNGQSSPYAELLEKLFSSESHGGHVLVTMNYDINLDRCAIKLRGSTADLDLDYGVNLANHRHDGAPDFSPPRAGRELLLLRLHGALNWARCWACQSIFTTVDRHARMGDDRTCWACGRVVLDSVLVHPSFLRAYDDPVIQIVWGRCREELTKADRWVFIGYSLPPADVHFREMLRECLRARDERLSPTKIIVVGRGPTDTPEFRLFADSYTNVFTEGRVLFWRATASGFGDFVAALA